MKYILNSAVITAPGTFTYRLIDAEELGDLFNLAEWESTIGYAETAVALGSLVGREIPVNRRIIQMQPGDEAIVFRLVLPPGAQRIDPAQKGALTPEYVRQHSEIGLLTRTA